MEAQAPALRTSWLRTALWVLGPLVLVIGVIVFFVAQVNSTDESAGPLPALPNAAAAPKVDQKIEKSAREVAGKFILTAVARKNTGASWALLDRTFPGKDEFTKRTWAKGDIPVIPFPVGSMAETRFKVDARTGKELQLQVLLIPKTGDDTTPQSFILGLRKRGSGWLVDYWATAYDNPVRSNPNQ